MSHNGKTLRHMRRLAIVLTIAIFSAAAYCEDGTVVKLTYESGTAGKLLTPMKIIVSGKPFQVVGSSGELSVGGSMVKIAASWRKSYYALGLDCNGDGQISANEYQKLSRDGAASFTLKIDGDEGKTDLALTFAKVSVSVKGNAVMQFGGHVYANCCMKGTYKGKDIRVIDDDLDGKLSQNGYDAICIGKNIAALPLFGQTQIGDEHCRLELGDDGKSITITPIPQSELQLGLVETPIKASMLKCLILADAKSGYAYDLCVSGKDGIPAGNYQLIYGVFGKGKDMLTMYPSTGQFSKNKDKFKLLTYEIKPDMINSIRIGPPFQVDFQCSYDSGKKEFTVQPGINIFGDGGEMYGLDFASEASTPKIAILNGNKVLSQGSMEHG